MWFVASQLCLYWALVSAHQNFKCQEKSTHSYDADGTNRLMSTKDGDYMVQVIMGTTVESENVQSNCSYSLVDDVMRVFAIK